MSKIRYISTRGHGKPVSFTEAMMSGMAPDGGLYIPDMWPELDHELLSHLSGMSYGDIAMQVMTPFVGDSIGKEDFQNLIHRTYEEDVFDHQVVAPLVQIGPNAWILELFHGPTLSFKDYALQLLGRLFDHVLSDRNKRVTVIGATSGDTGSAAIEACKECKNIDIFILHPKGRTSEFQRRQMTTVDSPNVYNIALEGTFDDCQAIVKSLFADSELQAARSLSAVNSINWARIMAQTVYYVSSALSLGAPEREVSYVVPTGNFGNVYAAWAARRMGLPIRRLTVATNRNDILTRFFESGQMKIGKVTPTISPSMDIQVSSNFERYLCDLMDRDHTGLETLMQAFRTGGSFKLAEKSMKRALADFDARRCSDEQTLATMRDCYEATGQMIDPHTAVALHAAMARKGDASVPTVVLACAHPAKFAAAVKEATGQEPVLPPRFSGIMERAERYAVLPKDTAAVKRFVLEKTGK